MLVFLNVKGFQVGVESVDAFALGVEGAAKICLRL